MNRSLKNFTIAVILFFSMPLSALAGDVQGELYLYLDADFTSAKSSSESIEMGIQTALSEVDYNIDGYAIKLLRKNHRGNTRRSLDNLNDFLNDPKALVVFAGLHSPPLLANRDFINKNQIPVLNPWAAAGPITRYPSKENWIFRLSIDDTKAGFAMVEQGIVPRKLQRPALLLEKTGWGKSNQKTILQALKNHGLSPAGVYWFNWGLEDRGARILLRPIFASDADSILLVGNTPEAKAICRALIELQGDRQLPVISHWGLTGGDFAEVINPTLRETLDLSFLQTRFSFLNEKQSPLARSVAARAVKLFPDRLQKITDIRAPAGFIHAYDLTRLFISAARKAKLTGQMAEDRKNLRAALEDITIPVEGLIKTYDMPFQVYTEDNQDAHEALGKDELVLGRYNELNQILLEQDTRR